jgi:hypothetical protein
MDKQLFRLLLISVLLDVLELLLHGGSAYEAMDKLESVSGSSEFES